MQPHLESFRGKKVFITGHTGFKGSWLAFILAELGAEVTGFALAPLEKNSHFELLNLSKRIKHIVGDIRDGSLLAQTMSEANPEYVFHLAAQALVRPSYADPVETFSTNVMGSVNLLEAVRGCDSVKSLVYITSDKAYENVEWVWGYRETDTIGGRDPYSASKGAAEIVFSSYLRSFFDDRPTLGAASTRAGNVIGGGDWSQDRIIPDCVKAISEGNPIILRSPNSTRPWQHVLEPLSGYLLLAARLREYPLKHQGAWNFGPETREVRTVADVANAMVAHLGSGEVQVADASLHLHEANLLQLNCDKAHQELGWYPRWSVDETLQITAEWYKSVLSGRAAEEVTREQVRRYFDW